MKIDKDFIDKDFIAKIIDKFAQEGKVFTNESQFQFELGYELQKRFDKEKTGYKVLFQVLSANTGTLEDYVLRGKDDQEKLFTDIIIDMGRDKCIAIELKYKISRSNNIKAFKYVISNNNYYAFGQGAYDEGCLEYWWDVNRLERLVSGDIKYSFSEKKVVKGFSIIITNDNNYYTAHDNSQSKNFFLVEGSAVEGKRKWYDKNNKCDIDNLEKGNIKYRNGITIKNSYKIEWADYGLPEGTECYTYPSGSMENHYEDYKFKYLILEIDKPKN